jgi:hypothetical protein
MAALSANLVIIEMTAIVLALVFQFAIERDE